MGDLPDYHEYVTPVSIEVPPAQIPVSWVAKYQSVPADLPDGETGPLLVDVKGRLYVRLYGAEVDQDKPGVIPRPMGGVQEKGTVTTTDTFQTVASKVVSTGKKFQLAKILVGCSEDVEFQLRWDGSVVCGPVTLSGKIPFTDWFPWNYKEMIGDGSKAVDIQARYPSGGSAGSCYGEIVGEEVT